MQNEQRNVKAHLGGVVALLRIHKPCGMHLHVLQVGNVGARCLRYGQALPLSKRTCMERTITAQCETISKCIG